MELRKLVETLSNMPYMEPNPSDKTVFNFNFYVDKKGVDECWPWKGYKQKSGHGQFRVNRQTTYAHRFAYFLANPSFDQDLCVCHKCDNPECVNPNHMFVGTHNDNTQDMIRKGRMAVGTVVGGKLEEKDIIAIRQAWLNGVKQSELATTVEMISISHRSHVLYLVVDGHI
jgi:hypothetical protein